LAAWLTLYLLRLFVAAADLIVRYAELLAANGRLAMALEYLEMIPGGWEGMNMQPPGAYLVALGATGSNYQPCPAWLHRC
jgi:hypothetical protein